ncbi:TPA: hypothetical protein ACVGN8_006024 [Pseudomonas aeruginosa]
MNTDLPQLEQTIIDIARQELAAVAAFYRKREAGIESAQLNDWVSEDLRRWRQGKDNAPIHRQILPPAIPGSR